VIGCEGGVDTVFALDRGEHWDEVPLVVDLRSTGEGEMGVFEIRRDLV
jgi:hypothetical protein